MPEARPARATAVLVANRGEIARRVIRTAKRMGFQAIAVFSDADADAPFVHEADHAIRLGAAPASQSYLASERIVAAARESGAELVHPGYGFLAEDPAFAAACAAAGLRFVGPTAEVLRAVGDKAAAKDVAERSGVPVLPGYRGRDQRDAAFLAAAATTGYPVMVKPAAGGGGIGMQLVDDERSLRDALARARRIATGAFGDERLILERAVVRARHVEVQILGDLHGHLETFDERDCSAQRRHQKVLEETPSPAVSAPLRERLRSAALAVARAVGYTSAGTVEFLVDQAGTFSFLEVNARLQVEHPVTEETYGVDLVELQLRAALGEPLRVEGTRRGASMEARLYAEDAHGGFVPSTGTLEHVRWPGGVRVDAGYEEGSTVTRFYDPLIAKIIARGPDRASALASLARALDDTEALGVRTNLAFLRALVAHPEVRSGRVDTELVERDIEGLTTRPGPAPDEAFAVAAVAAIARVRSDRRDPWSALGPWRAGAGSTGTVMLRDGAEERAVRVTDGERVGTHRVVPAGERHRWAIDGGGACAAPAGTRWWIGWRGDTYELETSPRDRGIEALAGSDVVAPMPGVVIAVGARADDRVRRGDLLCVVEAMKMELRVEAPADGRVVRVLCAVGDQVRRGQRLVEFDAAT